MESIKVKIGTECTMSNGAPNDDVSPVEFEGEKLASESYYLSDDTRGIKRTLYCSSDERYIIYEIDWSNWQGEATYYRLVQVYTEDLENGGKYEKLGREAGIAGPLTLDQALEQHKELYDEG